MSDIYDWLVSTYDKKYTGNNNNNKALCSLEESMELPPRCHCEYPPKQIRDELHTARQVPEPTKLVWASIWNSVDLSAWHHSSASFRVLSWRDSNQHSPENLRDNIFTISLQPPSTSIILILWFIVIVTTPRAPVVIQCGELHIIDLLSDYARNDGFGKLRMTLKCQNMNIPWSLDLISWQRIKFNDTLISGWTGGADKMQFSRWELMREWFNWYMIAMYLLERLHEGDCYFSDQISIKIMLIHQFINSKYWSSNVAEVNRSGSNFPLSTGHAFTIECTAYDLVPEADT